MTKNELYTAIALAAAVRERDYQVSLWYDLNLKHNEMCEIDLALAEFVPNQVFNLTCNNSLEYIRASILRGEANS